MIDPEIIQAVLVYLNTLSSHTEHEVWRVIRTKGFLQVTAVTDFMLDNDLIKRPLNTNGRYGITTLGRQILADGGYTQYLQKQEEIRIKQEEETREERERRDRQDKKLLLDTEKITKDLQAHDRTQQALDLQIRQLKRQSVFFWVSSLATVVGIAVGVYQVVSIHSQLKELQLKHSIELPQLKTDTTTSAALQSQRAGSTK